ncbi:tRNA (guanosine(37)-N1)-methyltransferase TrmD [Eubacteriales bacterium OttesenSCG-928-N14]|nr:tRNA (guanosine(37)-N1)-methyltransferase TrmD [Eubacteriales bacterium OttesenSCG-928-N14]
MRISILTLFPKMFNGFLQQSILGRAIEAKLLSVALYDIRDYADNKHRQVDDYPFGGGAGMLMMPQPIFDCMADVTKDMTARPRRIYLSPAGKKLDNALAKELAKEEELVLLCGHYEGIDARVVDELMDDCVSIGDYVLSGGEIAAMVVIDALMRFVPGVLGSSDSALEESFSDGLLEYPQYTRPAEFRGLAVPEVLLGGNHAQIERWRREQSLLITKRNRPDLLQQAELSQADMEFLENNE